MPYDRAMVVLAVREQVVLEIIARHFGVRMGQFTDRSREARFARARHAAMWIFRLWLSLTLEEVGAIFGGRDHSSVSYAMGRMSMYFSDPNFRATMENIRNEVLRTAQVKLPELPALPSAPAAM